MSKKKKTRRKPKPDPTQAALAAVERIIGGKLAKPSKKPR